MDGAYIGGLEKFHHMCTPYPAIARFGNQTVRNFLGEIAFLCADHYATIDTEEYDRLYNPAPEEKNTQAPIRTRKLARRTRQWKVTNPKKPHIVVKPLIKPFPRLQGHDELLTLFYRWATQVKWPAEHLVRGSEDAFSKARPVPSDESALGSSQNESSQVRASKRMKLNDGTPLASVSGNVERTDSP